VSRFWLTYNRSGRLVGVVIVDSRSLTDARISAAGAIDLQAEFAEGHQIDESVAALVPAKAICRMLSPEEAHELLDYLERGGRETARRWH
jgi:type II secretory pathway predicted ATPase ExeA